MKYLSLFLLVMLSFSCHQGIQKQDPPKDLIPHEKMALIVKDLILIEGHISITYKQIQSYHKILSVSSEEIFKKHKVSIDRYESSFEFYASDQKKLTDLYSDVLDQLTEEKGKLNTTPQ